MRSDHFELFSSVRDALIAAEAEHPESAVLKLLHARAGKALAAFSHLFTDDQYSTLSGGTNKDDG